MRAKNADLQRRLDEQVLESTRAVAALAAETARAAAHAELQQRMSTRATAAVDAGFPAGRLGELLERWAEMGDDVFEAFVDGLAALPSAAPADSRIPAETALHVGRESTTTSSDPLKEWHALRREAGGYVDFSRFH